MLLKQRIWNLIYILFLYKFIFAQDFLYIIYFFCNKHFYYLVNLLLF